ncbi:MAG: hypothetical protein ACFFB0_17975 [Promethearchaeota archaeon]
MLEIAEFQSFGNLKLEEVCKKIDSISQALFNKIKSDLNLEPFSRRIKFGISKTKSLENTENTNISNIGVKRYIQNNILIIKIYEDYIKFLNFILFREIYGLFIPNELKNYESIQIIINQIIINDLYQSPHINEWRILIREKIEHYDYLTVGFNRLAEFDRVERFFKLQRKIVSFNPTRFFFHYIRKNKNLIHDRKDNFHLIFFKEFQNYLKTSIINNEDLIETIRCIIKLFYKIKNYKSLLDYKKIFQEFKKNNEIDTDLSLRKFSKNIDWIKKYSYIAPSYQINWNAINLCIINIFIRFNPILNKKNIFSFIEEFPFFLSPKISYNSFAVDLAGYIIIPVSYIEDLVRYFKKLKELGYVLKITCLLISNNRTILNLNYFRKYLQKYRVINPNHQQYNKKYEIEFQIEFGKKFYKSELNLLDFLILDRIRFFSVSGLGFERRLDTLKDLKSDLLNEIIKEHLYLKDFKNILQKFHKSVNLKNDFLKFLDLNKKFGFFTIKSMLEKSLILLKLIEKVINRYPDIDNFYQFKYTIENKYKTHLIEENIMLTENFAKNIIFKEIFPVYFKSKKLYKSKTERLRIFYDLINSCTNLKIFSLNSIKKIILEQDIVDTIYKKKELKLKAYYEKFKLYKITRQEIDKILERFLNNNPPIIQPLLINTISSDIEYIKDFFQLILNDSQDTRKIIRKIKILFPRTLINYTKNIISNKNVYCLEISTPNLNQKEKERLLSILYNRAKDDLQFGEFFIWSGYNQGISRKNFYDFDTKKFFYSKELFEQFFLYTQRIFGKSLSPIVDNFNKNQGEIWSKEMWFLNLIKTIEYEDNMENIEYTLTNLYKLQDLNLSLKQNLLDDSKFRELKQKYYFKKYIKSIKFIPAFHQFGFEQFFLYLYPTDMNEIDFKMLLINTFQKVQYPACIDNSNSLFIKYIMPHRTPNMKYINWLTKSKKVIREYCACSVKKVHQIFHFNYNLNSEGWEYNSDKFKKYLQNILFNPNYKVQVPETKTFNLDEIEGQKHFGPDSPEFEALTQIYNWCPLDLKTYLGTKKRTIINHITTLLRKNLIFPYLSLKSLGFQEKLYIILPNTKKEQKETLIKIFSFFNLCYIFRIEGEFFIYGFPQEKKFENGIMIKLYLPKCELSEFIKIFDLLFQNLEINHYLILRDLIDGTNLIKSIYGNLDFLNSYNPLTNLKYNPKDKIWMNHKLFTKKFEYIYPNLILKETTDH